MKRIIILCIILLLAFTLSACDPYVDRYPWKKADSWHCEEIDFSIIYRTDSKGKLLEEKSTLIWSDKTLEVDVSFRVDYFRVGMDSDQDGAIDALFTGTWKYQDGKMIFYIYEDFLFDGAYDTLTFAPNE